MSSGFGPLDAASNKEYFGVIVDRNGPDNSVKVLIPELHGPDLDPNTLGWSRFRIESDTTNYGTPDLGQMVRCVVNSIGGSHTVEITGIYQIVLSSVPAPGSALYLNQWFSQWQTAVNTTSPINIPPNIVEGVVNGAVVRQIVEKGVEHSHSLFNNIISNGAVFPLNGVFFPRIVVDSALIDSGLKMTLDRLSSFVGEFFNLGNLISYIPDTIFNNLLPEIQGALQSITTLASNLTTTAISGVFIPGQTILSSVIDTITQSVENLTSVADVTALFSNLSSIALPTLDNITQTVNGIYGPISYEISALTGEVTSTLLGGAEEAFNLASSVISEDILSIGSRLPDPTVFVSSVQSLTSSISNIESEAASFLGIG